MKWPIDRMDLAIKAGLFSALKTGIDRALWVRLYRWHIKERTGGIEPESKGRTSYKGSVDDFLDQAKELFKNMEADGFDYRYPVSISRGGLRHGAHRLAASTVLHLTPRVEDVEGQPIAWDFKWFVDHGLSFDDQLRILNAWVRFDAYCSIFVLWPGDKRKKASDYLKKRFQVAGSVTLNAPTQNGFDALVYDVYGLADDLFKMHKVVRHKVRILKGLEVEVLIVRGTPGQIEDAKAQLRVDYGPAAHPPAVCHAASNRRETLYLADILLNPTYMNHLKYRSPARPEFIKRIEAARDVLTGMGINPRYACVVGGSVMEACGFRLSDDLDLTLTDRGRKISGIGSRPLADGIDLVSRGYHRGVDNPCTDDALIFSPERHFNVLGMKFAALDIVRERKRWHGRQKDKADVEMIEA